MERYEIGTFVFSKAGHDKNKIYVIVKTDEKNVYLVDGTIKKLEKPKCKNKKHIGLIKYSDDNLQEKLKFNEKISNEEIKYAIKCYMKQKDI